jgi:hypothetical protein
MAARIPPVIVADSAVAATASVAETNAVVTSNLVLGLRFVIMTITPFALPSNADHARSVFPWHVSGEQFLFQLFQQQEASLGLNFAVVSFACGVGYTA